MNTDEIIVFLRILRDISYKYNITNIPQKSKYYMMLYFFVFCCAERYVVLFWGI
jgi:hypothetical protein